MRGSAVVQLTAGVVQLTAGVVDIRPRDGDEGALLAALERLSSSGGLSEGLSGADCSAPRLVMDLRGRPPLRAGWGGFPIGAFPSPRQRRCREASGQLTPGGLDAASPSARGATPGLSPPVP